MNEVEAALPRVKEIIDKVDAPFRPIAFERLLEVVLIDARAEHSAATVPARTLEPSGGLARSAPAIAAPLPAERSAGRFDQFSKDFGVTASVLGSVIDIETGQLLTRNLGKSAADKTRTVAVLLTVRNGFRTGSFSVDRDELTKALEEHGLADPSNFNAYMRRTSHKGGVVFQFTDSGFKVPAVAEEYLADRVRAAQPTGGPASQ